MSETQYPISTIIAFIKHELQWMREEWDYSHGDQEGGEINGYMMCIEMLRGQRDADIAKMIEEQTKKP